MVTEDTLEQPSEVTDEDEVNSVLDVIEDDEDEEDINTPDDTDDDDERLQSEDDDDEDPIAKAVQLGIEAERERIRQETEQELSHQYEERQRLEQEEQEKYQAQQRLLDSFGETVKEIRSGIKKIRIRDQSGNPIDVELDDDLIQEKIIKPLNSFNQNGLKAANLELSQNLGRAAIEALPDAARDDFIRNGSNKPLNDWISTFGESYAPHSSYAKSLEKRHKAEIDAAEARGRARAKNQPVGQPRTRESQSAAKPKTDLTTSSGLARALANGDISQDKFRELWGKVSSGIW